MTICFCYRYDQRELHSQAVLILFKILCAEAKHSYVQANACVWDRNRVSDRRGFRIAFTPDKFNRVAQISLCFAPLMTEEQLLYHINIHVPQYAADSHDMFGVCVCVRAMCSIWANGIAGYTNLLYSPATPAIALNVLTCSFQSCINIFVGKATLRWVLGSNQNLISVLQSIRERADDRENEKYAQAICESKWNCRFLFASLYYNDKGKVDCLDDPACTLNKWDWIMQIKVHRRLFISHTLTTRTRECVKRGDGPARNLQQMLRRSSCSALSAN